MFSEVLSTFSQHRKSTDSCWHQRHFWFVQYGLQPSCNIDSWVARRLGSTSPF